MFRCNIGLHLYSLMLVLHLLIGSSILRLQLLPGLFCTNWDPLRDYLVINLSAVIFQTTELGHSFDPFRFLSLISALLPDLSYRFKELQIMVCYLLSMMFQKLFRLSCLEIWLYKANNIIIIIKITTKALPNKWH